MVLCYERPIAMVLHILCRYGQYISIVLSPVVCRNVCSVNAMLFSTSRTLVRLSHKDMFFDWASHSGCIGRSSQDQRNDRRLSKTGLGYNGEQTVLRHTLSSTHPLSLY